MIVETLKHKGHTIEIHYDQDSYASNPRQYDNVGVFVGFRNSRYEVGDKGHEIDPESITLDCKRCEGGIIRFPIMGEWIERECGTCDGFGNRDLHSFEDMIEFINSEYEVVGEVYPVYRTDHGNVSYSIGTAGRNGDRWDSSDAGVIFATAKAIEVTGCPEDRIEEALRSEVEEFSRWANGEVYGFIVKDRNGDEVEDGSSWGYIGEEWAIEAAKEAVPDEQPEVLIPCRLTHKTLDVIEAALVTQIHGSTETEDELLLVQDAESVLSLVREIKAKRPVTQTQTDNTDEEDK